MKGVALFARFAATNWVNCICLAGATYAFCVVGTLVDTNREFYFLFDIGIGPFILIFGYGIVVWPKFLAAVLTLDALVFLVIRGRSAYTQPKLLLSGLLVECIVVGCPFIYWAITQDYPLWHLLVSVFILSQLLWRRKKLQRLLLL